MCFFINFYNDMPVIISLLPLLYWVYLIDPFTSKIPKRNYLRLYRDKKYLFINLGISLLFIVVGLNMRLRGDIELQISVFTPLLFILISLFLNKYMLKSKGRDFKFILRGDMEELWSIDMLFSLILFVLPVVLSFYLEVKSIRLLGQNY